MKNKKTIHFLLIPSLITSLITSITLPISTPGLYASNELTTQELNQDFELTKEEQEKLQEIITAEIDTHIVKAAEQLKKIDSALEELAQVITNGLIRVKNKSKIILQIKSLRKFINSIANNPFSEADTATINFLLCLNKHLIDNIYTGVRSGLKNIPDINPEKLISKTPITSIEQLKLKYIQNEAAYQRLYRTIQTAGLSWTNIIYRSCIAAPAKTAQKYRLGKLLKWSLVIGPIVTYVAFSLDLLENSLGPSPKINRDQKVTNSYDLTFLGKIDAFLQIKLKNIAHILPYAIATTAYFLRNDIKNLIRRTRKTTKMLHYHLMGGVKAKDAAQKYDFTTPRFTFEDIVGLDHVKRELKPIVEYIKNHSRFDRINIGPEKGILFAGKPGTGKSFVAEALAGEIKKALNEIGAPAEAFRFIPFEASEILDIIAEKGVTDGIDAILSFAMKHAPCVVFIDEPDLLGLQRTTNKELLSKLLNVMNGFLSNNLSENVILLAATNRPDNLDPALLRRGRFGKIIHFDYPNFETRKKYLEKKLNPIVADLGEFDLEKLAQETKGITCEGLQSMVRKAFQSTKIKGSSLTQKALENALNQEIRQILPNTKVLSVKEQRIIAAQQASCAMASILLDPCDKLACVTINPVLKQIRESSVWDRFYKDEDLLVQQGKIFTYRESDSDDIYSQEDIINSCKICLAGSLGEEILLGSSGHTYNTTNKNKALKLALAYVSEGLDFEKMPKKVQNKFYEKALDFIQECKKEVKQLLEENKEDLQKLSDALIKHKTLDRDQIKAIILAGLKPASETQGQESQEKEKVEAEPAV